MPHRTPFIGEAKHQFYDLCCSGHPADPAFEQAIDKALAMSQAEPKQALPLVTESVDELRTMPVRALKHLLAERGISMAGLSEKQDLVQAVDQQCRTITYYA